MQTDKKQIIVKQGQSLWDIALQEYGQIETVFDIVISNKTLLQKIDDVPYPGTLLQIDKNHPLKDMATATALQSNGSVGTIISDDDTSQGSYSNDYSNDYQI